MSRIVLAIALAIFVGQSTGLAGMEAGSRVEAQEVALMDAAMGLPIPPMELGEIWGGGDYELFWCGCDLNVAKSGITGDGYCRSFPLPVHEVCNQPQDGPHCCGTMSVRVN